MSKLQPNFSWQAYQGDDDKSQVQFQLQREHIIVANAINTDIDDESYWSRERQNSFTWIDGNPIWSKTISGVVVGSATTSYPHGITNIQTLIELKGSAQDMVPPTDMIPLPYVSSTAANQIGLSADQTNIYLQAGNGAFNGYLFNVTIYYTKPRTPNA